jgi:hypothetical protein
MTWFNIPSTFIKIKNHKKYFWSIFVFLNIHVHYICFHKIYSNLSFYKMKWNNFFSNILIRLYFDIICKNIVKIVQKFEVGYSQTCTSLESSGMWHPKANHRNVLSPSISKYIAFLFIILCHISTLASKILAMFFNKIP